MGCHTNFYIPANLTYEQAKELAVANIKDNLNTWTIENIIESGKFKRYNWTVDTVNYMRTYYTRWLQRIESNKPIWKAAVWKFQKKGYLFGKLLYYKCEKPYFDDCIRVWGLSDIELTTLEETLEFFNNHKDEITYMRDTWLEEVTKFWELYPEGIISIG